MREETPETSKIVVLSIKMIYKWQYIRQTVRVFPKEWFMTLFHDDKKRRLKYAI
jgi:hypothetical protein